MDGEVALRFGLFALAGRLRDDADLVGFGLGGRGLTHGDGAADGGVAFGLGPGDFSVAANAGDVRPAHVGDVLVLVADLTNGERDHLQAHLRQVVHAGGAHALGDHFRLLDDLLDGELADDAAQVALHDEADQAFALIGGFGEELLGVKAHQLQRELAKCFNDREDDGAAGLDDARLAQPAIHNQSLVGTGLAVHAADRNDDKENA